MAKLNWRTMSCDKHPLYSVSHRPTSQCPVCWKRWATKMEFQRDKAEEVMKAMHTTLDNFRRLLNMAGYRKY